MTHGNAVIGDNGLGKQQPSLLDFPFALLLPDDGDASHAIPEAFRLATEVEARGPILHAPLDLLDLAKEQEGSRTEALQAGGDLLPVCGTIRLQRDDDNRLVMVASDGRCGGGPHKTLDGEVLRSGVYFWPLRERIHRLEANPEAPDRGQFLGALGDAADAAHIRLVEGLAEMTDTQLIVREVEANGPLTAPVQPTGESVLGVLKQLEDEVGAVVVAIGQQHRADASDVGAVAALVVGTDRVVVGGHQTFRSIARSWHRPGWCSLGRLTDRG